MPDGAFVYLGNSQPIREWNRFASLEDRGFVYGENRGANGIDGQLSTFLGQAAAGRENWALVGDLTALYDVQAAWAVRHAAGQVRVVVLNNGGGRIFERMFSNPRFQNRHALSFEPFAALWGWAYRSIVPTASSGASAASQRPPAVEQACGAALPAASLIEVRPDESQTSAFWRALSKGGAS
jgi:2-succinyl-5-enolpyruvyl-6-hydroxy-3-cyclohexene-1-carboxylate synthase